MEKADYVCLCDAGNATSELVNTPPHQAGAKGGFGVDTLPWPLACTELQWTV